MPIRKLRKKKESIIVFSAHNDDFVIGAGGTIKRYTDEGKKVTAVIFSYGEKSHPWLKKKVIQKVRVKEAHEAAVILGCKVVLFDLREFHFLDDYKEKNIDEALRKILAKEKPQKIFTHSLEDPHPDHKAVNQITMSIIEETKSKAELYVYPIWNPVSFRTTYPSLYVNIDSTFWPKLNALRTFHSQKIHIIYPFFLLLFRAVREGFHVHTRFAEKFFRLR